MIEDSKNVMQVKKEAYNFATQTGEIGSEHLLAGWYGKVNPTDC